MTDLVTELEVQKLRFWHVSQTNVCVMGVSGILGTISVKIEVMLKIVFFRFFNMQQKIENDKIDYIEKYHLRYNRDLTRKKR